MRRYLTKKCHLFPKTIFIQGEPTYPGSSKNGRSNGDGGVTYYARRTWHWIAIHVSSWTDAWFSRKHEVGEPLRGGSDPAQSLRPVCAEVLFGTQSDLVLDGRVTSKLIPVERFLVEDDSSEGEY